VSGALHGRRVVITGGSSGLGAALAAASAAAGASVAVIGRDPERLGAVGEATGAFQVTGDIGDSAAAGEAVEAAAEALGGIDALVNNAGIMLHSPIGTGLHADWAEIVRVNVLGMLHVTSAALPHLRAAERSDLVVVASTAADRVTGADYGVYAATKAAQMRLTDALRLELADDRQIRISLVKPGFMNTPGLGPGTRNPELQRQVVALKERIGLPPGLVADEICHLLALPPEVTVPELTIVPTARP
jgi:NADP-dependent 3-hydroxy acid dehydrogenase YdfG